LVLTDEERKKRKKEMDKKRRSTEKYKAQQKKYRSTEKYKAQRKKQRDRPEAKTKKKKYNKDYESRTEIKSRRKKQRDRPEAKTKKKKYEQSDRGKKLSKIRRDKPETRAKKIAYDLKNKDRIRAVQKIHAATPERRAYRLKFDAQPDQITKSKLRHAKHKLRRDNSRMNVLVGYSKRHSNSNIACCNCCGKNSHTEFLAIDHVLGQKQMDSVPELVKIGYSSKLEDYFLYEWIIDNDFPDGLQILCHNCNQSKENTKHNSCIHGNRDQTKFKPDNTAKRMLTLRMDIFPHYSKIHSNSEVACCRCCGENSNMEFLAIDHVLGKKVMDSIPELIELGYSSTLKQTGLLNWIKNNNYLSNLETEYFQILCHNCNNSKGIFGKCPMKGKPH